MNETYKFLQKTITRDWTQKTNEELCELYQATKDNELLSTMFCRNFAVWKALTKKYGFFINSEEYPSIILEELDKVMMKFSGAKNYKFMTFATTCLRNKLMSLNIHYEVKNGVERSTISYDAETLADEENCYLDGLEDGECFETFSSACIEMDMKHNFNLNDKERRICELILSGEALHKLDLAEGLKRDRLTIYKYMKQLKEKLIAKEEYLREA